MGRKIRNYEQSTSEHTYFCGGHKPAVILDTRAPLWYAKAILKNKRQLSRNYYWIFRALHGLIFLMGLALISWSLILGVEGPAVLLLIIGILGVSNFRGAIVKYQAFSQGQNWLITHLSGMISSGIAAYTAFLAFGSRQFLGELISGYWIIVPWMLPTIIGAVAIWLYTRRYSPAKSSSGITSEAGV